MWSDSTYCIDFTSTHHPVNMVSSLLPPGFYTGCYLFPESVPTRDWKDWTLHIMWVLVEVLSKTILPKIAFIPTL